MRRWRSADLGDANLGVGFEGPSREAFNLASKPWQLRPLGLMVAAGLVLAAGACSGDDDAPPSTVEGVETFEVGSRDHVTRPVDYEQTPPVGGPHHPVWMNCGFYEKKVTAEKAVHSMEHGAVWVTFDPGLAEAQQSVLRSLADDEPYLLVSPLPGLPSPVVASAWGVQLQLQNADDPRLRSFLDEYLEGPQTPEPGAPCTGGEAG